MIESFSERVRNKLYDLVHWRPYTYYVRHGWGLEAIRNKREARALYDFCKRRLVEMDRDREAKLNPAKAEVYQHTVELYHNVYLAPKNGLCTMIYCGCGQYNARDEWYSPGEFSNYVNDHVQWYWD